MVSATNKHRTTAHTEDSAAPEYKRLKGTADTHTQERRREYTLPEGTAAN